MNKEIKDNREIKDQILAKIKEYDSIIISRHIRPDGDAVGSTTGLQKILQASFPEKKIYLAGDDVVSYVAFLGEQLDEVSEEVYKNSLLIVTDTSTADRVSNKNKDLARELIKIDHHIEVDPFGDISWVEDWRSSACEMIVDFYRTYSDELVLTKDAALCLYTGMVTDSGRFRFDSTSGETLRCAATLLDVGIDTVTLFARLYLEDFEYLKFKSYVYEHMQITENGVAYIYVDKKMQEQFGLNSEQASNTISMLSEIKGSIIWVAFIDFDDGPTRARLRSRYVTINKLAEKYHGGGHACASGATIYSPEEMDALLQDADDLIKEYKANNFYL